MQYSRMSVLQPLSSAAKMSVTHRLLPGSLAWLNLHPIPAFSCFITSSRWYHHFNPSEQSQSTAMMCSHSKKLMRNNMYNVIVNCSWTCHVRSLATKPKNKSIQQRTQTKGGEVGAAKKVVQAGKDVTYLGIIIIGVGVTALMFFTVGKELFSSKSPNVVYTRALKMCKKNDEVTTVFGLPLKGYGEMTRRKRRRHVSHFDYEKDGVRHMRVKFYIEGPDKKGTVNCEVKENESGEFEYRYLFVAVDGYPPQTIVLVDNR